MALITDYTTLVAEVKAYAARSDSTFSNRFPVLVALAEDRIYNGHGTPGDPLYSAPIRAPIMEVSTTLTVTDGAATIPDNFLELRRLTRANDAVGMAWISPDDLAKERVRYTSGDPVRYTVEGMTLKTAPAATTTLTLIYYKRFANLTADAPTNSMITTYPLAWFNAVMFEAFAFMQDIDLATAWLSRYRSTVDGINRTTANIRAGGKMRSTIRVMGV